MCVGKGSSPTQFKFLIPFLLPLPLAALLIGVRFFWWADQKEGKEGLGKKDLFQKGESPFPDHHRLHLFSVKERPDLLFRLGARKEGKRERKKGGEGKVVFGNLWHEAGKRKGKENIKNRQVIW